MNKLYKVEGFVKKVLTEYSDTRNDDFILVYRVYREINEDLVIRELFCEVMLNHKNYNLPPIESITRCRRKLQREYPELRAVKEVQNKRDEEEKKYIDYAIDGYTNTFTKFVESN